MASEGQRAGESLSGLELAESIRKIAAQNARADLNNDAQLRMFLESWWSKTYNRPLKDPLLQTYTLEDLLYEFYDKIERGAAAEEFSKQQEIKEEEAQEKEVLDWADEEERKEAEAAAKKIAQGKPTDPTKDPANIKWMEEQMRLAKAELGDTFGEDLELNFDEK